MAKFVESGVDSRKLMLGPMEKPIRYRWQWSWMAETSEGYQMFEVWCKKISQAGQRYCIVCAKTIVYDNLGKRALKKPAILKNHVKAMYSVANCNCNKLHGSKCDTSH
ncbi:hypothetical protein PoB_001487300 [Plakobranchus ocellatus]|uniref:BED-type domain-containing protein n=1 Tax=Plakobranchus ocellatus TaxID=259542 RepID=A0AAV3Z0T0_9GAST|nr:hypothetical protein PoB_001487300 [Plakobranchus ocellatus]